MRKGATRLIRANFSGRQRLTMPNSQQIDAFLSRRWWWIAASCSLFAALRVLAFAAAYPPFNPVDELSHYAMIYEYSHGVLPGADLFKTAPEVAQVATLYGSSEYFKSRQLLGEFHRDKPIEVLPPEWKEQLYPHVFQFFADQSNLETHSPPFYYLLAACWARLGELFGARGWQLFYWVRFLNPLIYGAFVWFAAFFVKMTYVDRPFLFAAVPLLLAVCPQDLFYSVNRDVLSPLLAAAFLILLFRSLQKNGGDQWALLMAGLLAGIAFVTEVSNFVLFGALLAVVVLKTKQAERRGETLKGQLQLGTPLLAAAVLPIYWMLRNRLVAGDFTGSQAKIFYLGWVVKPWREWGQNRIFTLSGALEFYRELTGSFWRGEISWAGVPLRSATAEHFYVYSTAILVSATAIGFLLSRRREDRLDKLSDRIALYLLFSSVCFLIFISLIFDFQQCQYPSRAHPYFVSGRIIIGCLLPFMLLYLSGFESVWRPLQRYVHPILPTLAFSVAIFVVEVALRKTISLSPFNYYAWLNR